MLKIFRRHQLRKALKTYVFVLGPSLVKNYGQLDQYKVLQIQKTAQQLKLDMRYIAYAVAMYRHEESSNTRNLVDIDQIILDKLRIEIAHYLFDGNTNYRGIKVLNLSRKRFSRAVPTPSWIANRNGHTSL